MNAVVSELMQNNKGEVVTLIVDFSLNRKQNDATVKHFSSEMQRLKFRGTKVLDQSELLEKLNLTLNGINNTVRGSVAIFAAQDFIKVVPLHYQAISRLVLDSGFALSELLYAESRHPLHHILVFGGNGVRLFTGAGELCSEVTDYQPVIHVTHLLKSLDHSGSADEAHARGVKLQAKPKLHEAINNLVANLSSPVVVLGASNAGQLDQAASERVLALVDGNYEHASISDISEIAQKALDLTELQHTQIYLSEIDKLRHEKRLGAGCDEIVQLLGEGRLQTLYLEETAITQLQPGEAHELVDVDKSIALTLQQRGDVVFLPEGSLAESGGMVAGLRY
jgi:hypothetical protein